MTGVTTLSQGLLALADNGDFAAIVEQIPYAKWIGMTVEAAPTSAEVDAAVGLVGVLRYSDMLVGNPALPALHGGTIGALLESTAIFEVLRARASAVMPRTINITIDYLRSGKPVDTFCAATITKQGRRIVNVRAEAWQDDRGAPIAAAHAHFLVGEA